MTARTFYILTIQFKGLHPGKFQIILTVVLTLVKNMHYRANYHSTSHMNIHSPVKMRVESSSK